MSSFLETTIDWWSLAMWRGTVQGTVVICLALLVEGLWRNMPSASRSWLWRIVFVKLMLAFLCGAAIPLPILPQEQVATTPTEVRTLAGVSQDAIPTTLTSNEATRSLSWPNLLLTAWVVGVLGCVVSLGKNRLKICQRFATSAVTMQPHLLQLVDELSLRFAIFHKPIIRLFPGNGSPCVIIGRLPAILLPADWLCSCTAGQLRLALAHELAHLNRRDLDWNRLVAVCRGIFFFHPLVWLATRRYLAAQELACDDLAVQRTGESPAVMARLLLDLVEEPAANEWASAAAMVGANSTLRERIVAMNRLLNRTSPKATPAVAVLLAVACLLPPFSLAEQNASKSPADAANTGQAFEKSQRNGASASAFGDAQAYGFAGAGASGSASGNGNSGGFGRTQSSASATARVVTSGDDASSRKAGSPGDSPASEPKRGSSSASSTVKQKMTASNDGNGEKWSRTTEVDEDGREILIEESADEIRVAIKNKTTQRETVTIAKTAEELNQKNSAAYELYRKYSGDNKKTVKATAGANAFNAGNGLPDLKAFGELKGFGEAQGFGEGFGKAQGGNRRDAVDLMKQQIRELKQQAEVQGTPLQGLLDNLEQQIEQGK